MRRILGETGLGEFPEFVAVLHVLIGDSGTGINIWWIIFQRQHENLQERAITSRSKMIGIKSPRIAGLVLQIFFSFITAV